jgi:hypothetical protein
MEGPIEIQQTEGGGKPAQSIFERISIVYVPRVEVYAVKGDERGSSAAAASGKRYYQYFPASIVAHDKVFAPPRDPSKSDGTLPNLQIWRTSLEKAPIREKLDELFAFMKSSPDCQACFEEEKVVAILERPDFGKYLEECKVFWTKVRQQWGVK